ncbi:MAG: hypothetical protein IKA70_06715 [Alistipes sp.]|nr:hypothetical protein [Alistipes sp.]
MDNKLKELTDSLYGEGLAKGRADADRLITEAKAEAEKILSEAKAEAEKIIKQAEVKAADTQKNSMTEIQMAGRQAIAKIKSELAEAIIAKSTAEATKSATLDVEFIKKMLLAVAENWNGAGEKTELTALLPEALEKEFASKFEASAKEMLAAGVEVGYSKEVKSGFKVGAKNGGYYIAFTDESFAALMEQYLREKVSQMLFA